MPDVDFIDRNNVNNSLDKLAGFAGRLLYVLNYGVELKSFAGAEVGDAAATSPIDAILRHFGFDAAYTVETSGGAGDGDVTYTPSSDISEAPAGTDAGSATIQGFKDDVRHIMAGAFGNGVMNLS